VLAVRRRGAGVLGRAARGVPRDPRAALLSAQSSQHPRLPAHIGPARRRQGAHADPPPQTRRERTHGGKQMRMLIRCA
jgi:hypothetical protein